MLDYLFGLLSHDIGIDLGTANILVFVRGKGIVVREPSVVAQHKKTKKFLAIGSEAKKMMGKTPSTITAFRPLKNGVIGDFDATIAMLKYFIEKVHESYGFLPKIPRPKVVIGIPSGVTEVERRAVQEAAFSAGARKAYLIEEPMAAGIGANLPIMEAAGSMIVDIGAGTCEMAIISLGGIVINRSVRTAGDKMDEAIINFIRLKYSLLLGQPTAEEIKMTIGSAYETSRLRSPKATSGEPREKMMVIRGRDLETGLPKSVKIAENEIREALAPIVTQIVEAVAETIEETPPELIGDILEKGITLCGGGSLLSGFDKIIAERTKTPVWIADDPMTCVVRGCGKVLEDQELLNKVKVTGGLR